MTFIERNAPTLLSELVIKDPEVLTAVLNCSQPANAREMLLYGPAGSGKSRICRTLALHLTGNQPSCIRTINVSHLSAKGALANAIAKTSLINTWNPLEREVVILEELDGADAAAQRALKVILDEQAKHSLFLATTNELTGIGKPIRDRFEIRRVDRPEPLQWTPRARTILANEGVSLSQAMVQSLLSQRVPRGSSARDVLRVLQDVAASWGVNAQALSIAANTPAPSITATTVAPPDIADLH